MGKTLEAFLIAVPTDGLHLPGGPQQAVQKIALRCRQPLAGDGGEDSLSLDGPPLAVKQDLSKSQTHRAGFVGPCLLYTSDAADDQWRV